MEMVWLPKQTNAETSPDINPVFNNVEELAPE
jgi:hypothetical protein